MPIPIPVWLLGLLAALLLAAAWIYKSIMWPKIMKLGAGPIRIACVGDSITFGQGVLLHRRQWSYPAFLSALLGPEYTLLNYGLTNRTLLPGGRDYYFKEKVGKAAWESQGDILLFMLGTNDSKVTRWDEAAFEREYLRVVRHYQQEGTRDIYLMIPPKVFNARPGKRGCNDAVLTECVVPVIRRVAAACGTQLIDLYAVTREHRAWFPDKLHPNREGNQAIAEEIARHIRREG